MGLLEFPNSVFFLKTTNHNSKWGTRAPQLGFIHKKRSSFLHKKRSKEEGEGGIGETSFTILTNHRMEISSMHRR